MSASTSFDLTGQSALITGASRGIGFAIARGLAQQGARVTITARKPEPLQEAVGQLKSESLDVLGISCNQGDPDAIATLFEDLEKQDRTPTISVINAATNPTFGPLVETDITAWQKILDVNLTGSFLTAQHSAKRMLSAGTGSIIFISSVAGLYPMSGLGAYGISKAGMLGLMRALAQELGPKKVRVNAIAPGLIETRFSTALFENESMYDDLMKATPMGTHGQPEDIVGAAVYLASSASGYVTGQVLVVDGGSQM